MTTPNKMPPRRSSLNPLHLQVLGDLTKTKPTVWTHKSVDQDSTDPKKPKVIETKVVGTEVTGLARNLSQENVERLARRWS